MLKPSTCTMPAHIAAKRTPKQLQPKIWEETLSFSSYELFNVKVTTLPLITFHFLNLQLEKTEKATLVGTIRTNRNWPRDFATLIAHELYSSLVGFNETDDSSLHSYKCNETKWSSSCRLCTSPMGLSTKNQGNFRRLSTSTTMQFIVD